VFAEYRQAESPGDAGERGEARQLEFTAQECLHEESGRPILPLNRRCGARHGRQVVSARQVREMRGPCAARRKCLRERAEAGRSEAVAPVAARAAQVVIRASQQPVPPKLPHPVQSRDTGGVFFFIQQVVVRQPRQVRVKVARRLRGEEGWRRMGQKAWRLRERRMEALVTRGR